MSETANPGVHNFYGLPPEEAARQAEILNQLDVWRGVGFELKQAAIDAWCRSDSPAQREQMWHAQRALDDLMRKLQDRIDSLIISAKAEASRRRKAVT